MSETANTLTGRNGARSVRILLLNIPPSGNLLRRKYRDRHAYARLREEWERSIWYTLSGREAGWLIGMAQGRHPMNVEILVSHKKLYDTDNLYSGVKPILDALVRLKLLADDSPELCKLTVEQEKMNGEQTVIKISDAQKST